MKWYHPTSGALKRGFDSHYPDQMLDILQKSSLWKYCTETNEGIYFRYDVWPEGTPKENWTEYCDLQEELQSLGWTIDDVYIEHDCISGDLIPYAS